MSWTTASSNLIAKVRTRRFIMWCTWFIIMPYIWYPVLYAPLGGHSGIFSEWTHQFTLVLSVWHLILQGAKYYRLINLCWYCFNGKLKSCNVFAVTSFRQTSVRFSRYSVSSEDSWVTTFAYCLITVGLLLHYQDEDDVERPSVVPPPRPPPLIPKL